MFIEILHWVVRGYFQNFYTSSQTHIIYICYNFQKGFSAPKFLIWWVCKETISRNSKENSRFWRFQADWMSIFTMLRKLNLANFINWGCPSYESIVLLMNSEVISRSLKFLGLLPTCISYKYMPKIQSFVPTIIEWTNET